jgi:ribosomal protein S6--L-glutamate ligase
MRIVVLASADSWYLRDLQRAALGRHEVLGAAHRQLRSTLLGGEAAFAAGSRSLNGADAILVRTMEGGSLEQVVFRMDVLARFEAAGRIVVNSSRAIEGAVDKYLATAKCQAAGLDVPPTVVCQTVEDALDAFGLLGGDVVVKPLFGGEGRGIFRVTDPDCAWRAFKSLTQLNAALYLQRFIPHSGSDLRLFVVGSRVLGMRRSNPADWRSNVSRGATTEPIEVTDSLAEISLRAAGILQADIAGVDILPADDGKLYVLEVNAVPGWRALARTLAVDVAAMVLDHIEFLFNSRSKR